MSKPRRILVSAAKIEALVRIGTRMEALLTEIINPFAPCATTETQRVRAAQLCKEWAAVLRQKG